jgi:hypothetical protein
VNWLWPNARTNTRPSGTWQLIGDDRPCAQDDGGEWYWVALHRLGAPRIYSGVVRVPPVTATEEELQAELAQVVEICRRWW